MMQMKMMKARTQRLMMAALFLPRRCQASFQREVPFSGEIFGSDIGLGIKCQKGLKKSSGACFSSPKIGVRV